uniref:class I adenylate cyclase n=1 Tax=Thaumasiovibrio occultus TaxID=1891184 RepID=UPI000B357FCF|nr:class I adenylate cyclase [Thaumasiovibrio occultus]
MTKLQTYIESLVQRYDRHTELRLARARAAMNPLQQQIFTLLPALLQFNHPAIPGYVNADIPIGIDGFTLSDPQSQFISDCALTYGLTLDEIPAADAGAINGLYSMGSTASLGQSQTSDLDIWVCVNSDMPKAQRELLERKCQCVSEWAMSQGVEANFFLIDETRFRDCCSDEMTGDNCGSSQHLLLLDEFYRSALRLAGKRLLWFIVPPEMEECYDEYLDSLVKDGALKRQDWIDFGGLSRIPAAEYFGSSLWQLYKSIDSPYKSVLKAILLEAYSCEYPHTQLLSVDIKRRFFAVNYDPTQQASAFGLDGYYLMLEKVTRYLERIGDHRRLDLVRRCFYLKTHEKLTRDSSNGSVPWRREVLSRLTHSWEWQYETLHQLDNRRLWKVEQVRPAHNELLDALMLSYRNLIRFARKNSITATISPEDISILARKLYAAFEVLPGKVDLLNQQLSPDMHEDDLSFIQVGPNRTMPAGWYIYKQSLNPVDIIGRAPLENNNYLSKLIGWAFFNGLLTDTTHLHTVVRNANLDIDKLYQMVSDMRNTFSLRRSKPGMQALASPCEIRQLAMFINLENDPTTRLSSKAVKFDFKNTDIFSFGEEQACLVGSVDFIYRNSWNEVRTLHFTGENAMLDALKTVLGKMHQEAIPPESVDVFCYSKHMRGLIRNVVYQLVAECIEMRLRPLEQDKRRRFKAIRMANQTYGLFFERRGVSVQKLENSVDFYSTISSTKIRTTSELMLKKGDPRPPEIVDTFASEGLIQFFFEDCAEGYNVYILDEANRIEVYRQCNGHKDDMVHGVSQFYTSAQGRVKHSAGFINFNLPQFYNIVRDKNGEAQVLPYRTGKSEPAEPVVELQHAALGR